MAIIEIMEQLQEQEEERGKEIAAKLQEHEIRRARGEMEGAEEWMDLQTLQKLLTIYCEVCAELKGEWVMCEGCKFPICRTCADRCPDKLCPFCKTGKLKG